MDDDDDAFVPDFEAARDLVVVELIRFTHRLRRKGIRVPATASLDGAQSLARVGIDDEDQTRNALRASLLTGRDDIETFEAEFPQFWTRLRAGLQDLASEQTYSDYRSGEDQQSTVSVEETTAILSDAESDSGLDVGGLGDHQIGQNQDQASERIEDRRTSTYSPEGPRSQPKHEETDRSFDESVLVAFERTLSRLAGRRRSISSAGDRLDVRRILRENVQMGGVPLDLPVEEPRKSELKACVLVDVSRSVLDTINREFLLTFLDRLQDRNRGVRTFIFDTDIREVTDLFGESSGSPKAAFEQAGIEWGGGTRIGASLATLRRKWPYAVDNRTVLIVISDGLDVGEVDTLELGMTWLSKRSAGILWLNPLAASPEYEPLCRGINAALPYVDGLFAFTEVDDLADISRQLERQGIQGSIGYEYDHRQRVETETE